MDLSQYKKITYLLFICFMLCFAAIIVLNMDKVSNCIIKNFSELGIELLKQFFYGSLGATIACSIFLAKDKDENEEEFLKGIPDKTKYRMPDEIDRMLYIQRIISSGVLAVAGTILIIIGYGYLEVDFENGYTLRQKLLFAVSSFLIGIYQSKFLVKIEGVFENLFKTKKRK